MISLSKQTIAPDIGTHVGESASPGSLAGPWFDLPLGSKAFASTHVMAVVSLLLSPELVISSYDHS